MTPSKGTVDDTLLAAHMVVQRQDIAVRAIEDRADRVGRQLAHRHLGREVQMLGQRLEDVVEVAALRAVDLAPRRDRAIGQRARSVGMISSGSSSRTTPRPPQVGQAPLGLLNEKSRGSSELQVDRPMHRACVLLRERQLRAVDDLRQQDAAANFKRSLDRIGDPHPIWMIRVLSFEF